MFVTTECIPCYLQQAINTLDKGEVPREKRSFLLKELLPMISTLAEDKTPAENSTLIIHKLVEMVGGDDPFKKAKQESNKIAMSFLEQLKDTVQGSADPLFTALKISVAGNVVDLGIFDDFDLSSAIKDALEFDFSLDDYDDFKTALSKVQEVFIIGDNSGEIVFDTILVSQLQSIGKEITYGVKGGFILNDATLEDAEEAGMTKLVRVVDNGNNYLGTIEEHCSKEFLAEIKEAGLIISKGQANYESLEGTGLAGDKTYFLLKAKCPVVAGHLGAKYGDIVFTRNKVRE